MANTAEALISQQPGDSVATAWPQVTPNGVGGQNLDLLQIVTDSGSCLLNVDYQGTVHKPASSPTTEGGAPAVRIGAYLTRLTSAATTAQLFADAFYNPSLLDILQVIQKGGNIHYYLDYLGVAHGS